MMQGYSLSASLPEDTGLGERFWYWRGVSGQSYIHSIYPPDFCPPVPGAVFVIVRKSDGVRNAIAVGRFGEGGSLPADLLPTAAGHEVHVHLLTRDEKAVDRVLQDLRGALQDVASDRSDLRSWRRPVQLELLAA